MDWNRPTGGADASVRAHQGKGRAIPAVLVLAVALAGLAGALVWWLRPEGDGRSAASEGDGPATSAIKEVSPARVAKPAEVAEEPKEGEAPVRETIRLGSRVIDLTKLRAENPAEYNRVTGECARVQAQLEKFRREPAQGRVEQLLLMVSPGRKGERVPPPPIGAAGDEELEKEAEETLEKACKVEEWDTELTIGIKEELERLKDEWHAAKQSGRSFHAFLQSKLDAAEHDADVLETSKRFDRENYNDRTMSDEDYAKSHEKVNRLLEMQGFERIKRPDAEEEDDN